MPAPFADVHPGPAAIEGPAGLGVHQPQRVEAAEGQPRERVRSAGERRVHAPGRMASAAWPIAIVLDAQAATMQERGPSNPNVPAMTSTGVLEKWFHASDGRACSMPRVVAVC